MQRKIVILAVTSMVVLVFAGALFLIDRTRLSRSQQVAQPTQRLPSNQPVLDLSKHKPQTLRVWMDAHTAALVGPGARMDVIWESCPLDGPAHARIIAEAALTLSVGTDSVETLGFPADAQYFQTIALTDEQRDLIVSLANVGSFRLLPAK